MNGEAMHTRVWIPDGYGGGEYVVRVPAVEYDRLVEANKQLLAITAGTTQESTGPQPVKLTGNVTAELSGHLDEIDAPTWPFINAEAAKVGGHKGHIDTYQYERGNGGVAVLWNSNRLHALTVTVRDPMNRTHCIRVLVAAQTAVQEET